MIKATELRLNNFLQDRKGQLCKVERLSNDPEECRIEAIDNATTYLPVTPIPLTEEWLLKLGFEYEDLGDDPPPNLYRIHGIELWDFNGEYWIIDLLDQAGINREFRYIHELQNAICALTGQELTINKEEE